MSLDFDIRQINKNLLDASNERFYVLFQKIPENFNNILSRQVISFSRPDLSFEVNERRYKGNQRRSTTVHQYTKVRGVFRLDDNGLILHALMSQYYRQKPLARDFKEDAYSDSSDFDPRFIIQIDTFNANHHLNGSFKLHNCLIQNIKFDKELGFMDQEVKDTVTVTFDYEGFDFNFVYDTNIPIT